LVPTPCAHCGSVKSIESHHHSYEPADWLDVIWLCSACHMALHRAPRVTLAVPKLRLA
jgi:predicted HNH restriction endonuclease